MTINDTTWYGRPPFSGGFFPQIDLPEMMYYLYLPVYIQEASHDYHDQWDIRLPPNLECLRPMINRMTAYVTLQDYPRYIYVSARKGWASPDNPLNRPGWHCDGFGTEDINAIWWKGPGTRFALQKFENISDDHLQSLEQFKQQVLPEKIWTPKYEGGLHFLDRYVVHATPIIEPPGCMRQFVKISFSNHRYNLADNSHNYLFDYNWKMYPRDALRNDPHKAGCDYVEEAD